MLYCASSPLHAYAMLHVEQDVCLHTDEPGELEMDIIPVFQLRELKLKEVKHSAQRCKADGGWRAELGLMLGLEHPSGTFPTVSVCLV